MKIYLLILSLFMGLEAECLAQKKLVDSMTNSSWEKINGIPTISANGKYVLYQYGSQKKGYQIVLQQTFGQMQRKVLYHGLEEERYSFSPDNRYVKVTLPNDSLLLLCIAKNSTRYFANASSFQFTQINKQLFLHGLQHNQFKIINLYTGKDKIIEDVKTCWFNINGDAVVLNIKDKLSWLNISSGNITTFFQGDNVSQLVLNRTGTRAAFLIVEKKSGQFHNTILSAKKGTSIATIRASDTSNGLESGLLIANSYLFFNKSGNILYFYLQKEALPSQKKANAPAVDIWNYQDEKLQAEQLSRIGSSKQYLAASSEEKEGILRLQQEEDDGFSAYPESGEYFIVTQTKFGSDSWWHKDFSQSLYIVSMKTGIRKAILRNSPQQLLLPQVSPEGHFVTWFNDITKQYCSYEIATGITHMNITQGINVPIYQNEADFLQRQNAFGIAAWLAKDGAMLIYDRYDIWKVDPVGLAKPINITHGYGRLNQVTLRVLETDWMMGSVITPSTTLFLSAFNQKNKQNGFYMLGIRNGTPIRQCTMGDYIYFLPLQSNPGITGLRMEGTLPIKATNSNSFLLQRMSATEAPNLFVTKDFKSFRQLTDIQPQKQYNWLTAELINWTMLNGEPSQGILYKPENFNPAKKYPLIFHYYEQKSSELNKFRTPGIENATVIDIPSYVSNGYLVFVPDIHFLPGKTGDGAVNAIVSATKYLSKLPYVDSNKLGLQGHSFAGFQTNYLITHSNLFAAACEAAGQSDFISGYSQLKGGKFLLGNTFTTYERYQSNIRAALWEKPELYIKNSPVFLLDKVSTPLLILHNITDDSVPFEQAIEMFLGLRRAGKKVWLLQYDNEESSGHVFNNKINANDFTIRMRQFFDHYLKDAPPPKWMTEGVPARLKGIESGLELDTSGKQP